MDFESSNAELTWESEFSLLEGKVDQFLKVNRLQKRLVALEEKEGLINAGYMSQHSRAYVIEEQFSTLVMQKKVELFTSFLKEIQSTEIKCSLYYDDADMSQLLLILNPIIN